MKKNNKHDKRLTRRELAEKAKLSSTPLKISFGIIVLVYILIPNFTPNWMTLDTNASKFLTTAIVNLLAFIYLLLDKDLRRKPNILTGFFKTWPGLALTGLLVMTLVSFTQAINPIESILESSKLITLIMATYVISVILTYDIRYMRMIAFVLTGILIFDSVSVFYYITEFINRNINAITDIKTVYSNKNILASAIYVKIPAALWLMLFEKGWLKRMGVVALFFGFVCTLFMATRTFYLGLIVATLLFLVYAGYNYFREREKRYLGITAVYIGALVLALGIFSVVQTNLYPSRGGRHTQGVGQQLATIASTEEGSNSIRLQAWGWSLKLIKENPLLGVGAGNWKVAALEYENQDKPNFIYSYKAHNDFLEITAERGIFGGLFYIAIFGTVFLLFLRAFFRREAHEDTYKSLFFAATGVFFYSMDAFFNFPGDRPEILALFALFVGTGIAAHSIEQHKAHNNEAHEAPGENSGLKKHVGIPIIALIIAAMAVAPYVFYLNFESSKLQRVVYQEIMATNLREPADRFVEGFTWMPNISHWGESVSTLKARYLLNEKRPQEAIDHIKDDLLNPYDGRREYFMAVAYLEMEMPDSALHYALLSHAVKPMYFRNFQMMLSIMEQQGRIDEMIEYLEDYVTKDKRNANAWIMITNAHNRVGNLDRAYELIQEAHSIMPRDSLVDRQQRFLHFRKNVEPHRPIYNRALTYFQANNHAQALPLFTEYLDLVPDDAPVYRQRALAYYYLRQYENSIKDIERVGELATIDGAMLNLRGACLQGLGRIEEACRDFEAAMNEGNANGLENYNRFCRNLSQQ